MVNFWSRWLSVTEFVFVVLLSSIWLAAPVSAAKAITVQSGQSIQKAINNSTAGDVIFVTAGRYAEQLTIKRSGTTLIGVNAVLVPPKTPVNNTCSGLAGNGTEAGICITGADVDLATFITEHRKVQSVGHRVSDVLITGFEVRNFSGINIAVVGAQNALVTRNNLINGAQYGVLTVGSNNSHIDNNLVTFTRELGFIAICMDDVGGNQVTGNIISGYAIGLCVQTPGADVRGNTVTNGCIGAYVDPGVHGAEVSRNHVSAPKPLCASLPDVGIEGIVLGGSVDTLVTHNLIEGMKTPNGTGAGIVVIDFPDPLAVSANNTITENVLRLNDVDIFINSTGKGNVAQNNTCNKC